MPRFRCPVFAALGVYDVGRLSNCRTALHSGSICLWGRTALVPEIGKKYGPYEILGHLGGGGMGFVYRAWDARLHREVAIKLLHSEYTMPGMRERFLREARAASALNHPNICTIFDIGEQNGEPYLVMELLEGQTLKDLIDYRTVQVDELLSIAREVGEALGAAHSKGVIHRDIKPANIFLVDKPNGSVQAKVLDFGLAKFQGGVLGARSNRSLDLTAAGATVGTLAYMSPEQARGEILDSRTDLFSLGVVLYEMATRHIPFPGATSALVFVQLLNHQPESVRNWNDAVPRELDRIIFKLMAKERTQRFQTAQELEEALAKVGEKGGGWLRKASNVPLVRAADPVAREKRTGRKGSDSAMDTARTSPGVPLTRSVQPALRVSSDAPQVLRPVARLPRADPTPAAGLGAAPRQPVSAAPAGASTQPVAAAQATQVAVVSSAENPVAKAPPELDSGEFAAALAQPYTERPNRAESRIKRPPVSRAAVVTAGAILLLIGIVVLLYLRGHFRSILLTRDDSVVLTEVENRTGDKMLDGAVTEGLQIALAESPYLRLQRADAYRIARRLVAPDTGDGGGQGIAQNVATRLGAKAYLFGTISGAAAPYLIHLDLLDTASNDVMTSVEASAPSLQEIPTTIDHLAAGLRAGIGESSESISKNDNPLSREATTSLEALHALAQGDAALDSLKTLDALRFYQQAASVQPKFVQAQLRLAAVYRREHAEVAAAEAARLALAAADDASQRTRALAQYEYEMNVTGDYIRAAGITRQLVTAHPHDTDALQRLAHTLRLEGRVGEALQTAQLAYTEDPYNLEAYTEAENALIGLDRYEAAAQVDAQAQKMGVGRLSAALTSAYLGGRPQELAAAIAALENKTTGFRPDWNYGIYLDNIGQLQAGSTLWHSRAAAALEVKGLESTAAVLLAQGAIDRALFGDCPAALAMVRDADAQAEGINATFNAGMASALCGNSARAQKAVHELEQNYPQSFAVKGFYVADINAGLALHDQDPTTALDQLKSARQYDLISLTPVLRGRAHVALRQVQIGIVDFQTVLSHRGVPFIVGNVSYPVAQIGVARAFADTGDLGNSAEAYRRFVELWKNADPNLPMLVEARAHSH
jgi:serine/threonine protein kinase/tetratricopeptide (TPR) repeat protein